MGFWSPGPDATDGDDIFFGDGTDETANGGLGNDNLIGRDGADTLHGGAGNDWLQGGTRDGAADVLFGGDGDDHADLGDSDSFDGGDGIDELLIDLESSLTGQVVDLTGLWTGGTGSNGSGVLSNIEAVGGLWGSAFDDTITIGDNGAGAVGGAGDDVITATGAFANTLFGYTGNDTLNGGGGNDTMWGGGFGPFNGIFDPNDGGDDTLNGGDGDDILHGGDGADLINGDEGGDELYGDWPQGNTTVDGAADVLFGGDGDDHGYVGDSDSFDGGDGIDELLLNLENSLTGQVVDLTGLWTGGTGSNGSGVLSNIEAVGELRGSAFDDTITIGENGAGAAGGGGDDVITATGAFANTLFGGTSNDTLNGGGGNDTLTGDLGFDTLNGGSGSDTVRYAGAASGVTITLGAGADLDGDGGTDTLISIENIVGSAFNDSLTGNGLANTLDGGDGGDVLNGLGGADVIAGGDGGDELIGNTGADSLDGGAGDDTLRGGSAGDVLDGGEGIDTATYSSSTIRVIVDLAAGTGAGGEAAGETLANIESLIGSAFNDILTGSAVANTFNGGDGDDTLFGGGDADVLLGAAGNDTLNGGAGGDTLTGGSGSDIASYAGSSSGVSVNLGAGTASGGDAAGDVLVQIENLLGSAQADTLTGNAAANVISGGAGIDVLNGAAGADTLTGGLAADTFVFNTALGAANIDAITDFSVPQDTINLESAIFTGLAAGALAAGAFRVGASASDASDRIIYNSATGALYFDADGNGAAAQVQFATLAAGLALTAGDFVVI